MSEITILIGQSGGPTAVINATLVGLIMEAKKLAPHATLLGCHHGIDGILHEDFISLSEVPDTLSHTPGMYLGSVRKKMPRLKEAPEQYEAIVNVFTKHHITHFFYIGGNDSMDTASRLAAYFSLINFPCVVMGLPKTIDNDLVLQDHTPGYGSSAKYLATTLQTLAYDTAIYPVGRVTIVEVMGRDTGWLAAATCIPTYYSMGPDLIYIPEIPFNFDSFTKQVKAIYQKKKRVLVVASEGIKNEQGEYISSTGALDRFGHPQLGGVAPRLASYIESTLGIGTRAIEISLSQRGGSHLLSKRDYREALTIGRHALRFGLSGHHGMMVIIKRKRNSPYKIKYQLISLSKVANFIKSFPIEWMNVETMIPTPSFLEYVLPLVEGEVKISYEHGIPKFAPLSTSMPQKLDD
ncbi:MAG: 6-phosphofructokinase [Bacilli bacterium]|nr:6-phosphofructokinase [Bacilli bacterium]